MLLKFLTLDRLQDEYAGNLSYGQQKLLEIAEGPPGVIQADARVIEAHCG